MQCQQLAEKNLSEIASSEMKFKTVKIFVYGTLKRGGRLNGILKGCKFLGEDELKGYDIYSNGSYPMIVKGKGTVKGEVFEVPKTRLRYLDFVEGAYNRMKLDTRKHKDTFAYIYKYSVTGLKKLDGEFKG